MLKYILLLILTSYLPSYSSVALCEQSSVINQIQSSPKSSDNLILVFGDSLSAAYNIKHEQGWVSLLQNFVVENKISAKVINASISGETTTGGLERLEKQLTKSQADIIIIELGGNDALQGLNLETTRNNLKQMITLSHQYNARVILAGMKIPPNYGRTYSTKFEKIYNDLEKRENVILIPFLLKDVAGTETYMQLDRIHPNASAQPVIMHTVWQYLSPLLTEPSEKK